MAYIKVSGLPAASTVVDANEFEINEAGTSKKVTTAQIKTAVYAPADIALAGTGSLKVPTGTTAQRTASPATGMFRYNSTTEGFEGYSDGAWGSIGGGGGGSATETFYGLKISDAGLLNLTTEGSSGADVSVSDFNSWMLAGSVTLSIVDNELKLVI